MADELDWIVSAKMMGGTYTDMTRAEMRQIAKDAVKAYRAATGEGRE
jgi:hypothetical protein